MSYFAPNLPPEKHCFFGRSGGISTGRFASLNCNIRSTDSSDNIYRNLDIIGNRYGTDRGSLCLVNQGITNHAAYISHPSLYAFKADGLVTDIPGLVLGIKTADCAPVLLADYKNGIIAAAHAGWRGALRGILANTVKIMLEHGADISSIRAAVGPCLQQHSFEAGEDMYEEFIHQNPDYGKFFTPQKNTGRFRFDLEAFVIFRLEKLGIKNISASHIDTYTDEDGYFSFRRDTHRKLTTLAGDFPNHLSTITL